jgi:hypothetical protein
MAVRAALGSLQVQKKAGDQNSSPADLEERKRKVYKTALKGLQHEKVIEIRPQEGLARQKQ